MEKTLTEHQGRAIRWLITGFNPWTIAKTLNRIRREDEEEVTEDDVNIYLDGYVRMLDDIEKDYIEKEFPKVQQNIREMILEVPESERNEMKRKYLLGEVQEAKKNPDKTKVQKLTLQVHIFTGRQEGISPEQIVQATKYPIDKLIKVNKGMAKCPFHPDKNPSMDVRNNFYYCYGCGANGNSITLVRHLEHLSFRQAVSRLT